MKNHTPNDPSHLEDRERIAKGIRILVNEGLINNAGHISYRPPGANWFWTLRHVHVGLEDIGPGDVIACGTSLNAAPIKPGDSVEIRIDGIGALVNALRSVALALTSDRYVALGGPDSEIEVRTLGLPSVAVSAIKR